MSDAPAEDDPGIWSGRALPPEVRTVAENALRRYRDANRRADATEASGGVVMLLSALAYGSAAAELARAIQQLTGDPAWVEVMARADARRGRLLLTLARLYRAS